MTAQRQSLYLTIARPARLGTPTARASYRRRGAECPLVPSKERNPHHVQ